MKIKTVDRVARERFTRRVNLSEDMEDVRELVLSMFGEHHPRKKEKGMSQGGSMSGLLKTSKPRSRAREGATLES